VACIHRMTAARAAGTSELILRIKSALGDRLGYSKQFQQMVHFPTFPLPLSHTPLGCCGISGMKMAFPLIPLVAHLWESSGIKLNGRLNHTASVSVVFKELNRPSA
jgi:hypothetical protein